MNEKEKKTPIRQVSYFNRNDLEHIETRLLEYSNIKNVVVIQTEDGTGEPELCAYIVPLYFDSLHMIDLVDVRGFLSSRLPPHMIPSSFVILEELPQTIQGKIVREKLPLPEKPGREAYVPPGNEIQRKLVKLWSEVLNLGKKKIGIDADYFDLGGHSLNAIRLLGKIEKEFDVKLEMEDILNVTTIRGLAGLIKEKLQY